MEFRVLRYFLAVASEETISGAAKFLHLSQPTLSRQLKDLEDELGKQLIIRGKRKIKLTEEGLILHKRAREILGLASRARDEIASFDELISGEIHIGAGETEAMRLIAKAAKTFLGANPKMRVHLFSGTADDVAEKLDQGILDFGLMIEPANVSKFDFIKLPSIDIWGVLMRTDHPLASHETISPNDLFSVPLICSRRLLLRNAISGWLGGDFDKLNIVATFNLIFNAALMVEEGVGCALCLDKLIKNTINDKLCFRPLEPKLKSGIDFAWKKSQIFSKAMEKFLRLVQSACEDSL